MRFPWRKGSTNEVIESERRSMTISLYDAIIPSQLQIIGAVAALVDKAEAYCSETGRSEAEIVGARLAQDMLPFGYQVKSVREHSVEAIEGVRKGSYSPSLEPPPETFAELRDKLASARDFLSAIDPAEIEGFIGQEMVFAFKEMQVPFTAETFLLSFAQPNFYFHATTAYDILRAEGLTIGKRDFLGQLRARVG